MIMPKLVYKSVVKKEPAAEPSPAKLTEEKENSGDTVKSMLLIISAMTPRKPVFGHPPTRFDINWPVQSLQWTTG